MRKRVNFLLRAVAGLQSRCLVVSRYPGAGEVTGTPVAELVLGADAVSADCVLDSDVMWQAVLVDTKLSGAKSTHQIVFHTAKNLRVGRDDTAHSDSFRIESIEDEGVATEAVSTVAEEFVAEPMAFIHSPLPVAEEVVDVPEVSESDVPEPELGEVSEEVEPEPDVNDEESDDIDDL